jgi:hypothetical protein
VNDAEVFQSANPEYIWRQKSSETLSNSRYSERHGRESGRVEYIYKKDLFIFKTN